MLLSLKLKNFKSFYEETVLDFIANYRQTDHKDYLMNVVQDETINKFVLPSMVIYGSNASGKTSIIEALNTFKQIVINGTIKKQIKNNSITNLDISSFIHDEKKNSEPIHFEIKFKTKENNIYNYILEIISSYNLSERKIINEELSLVNYTKNGSSVKENFINLYTRNENSVKINISSSKVLSIYNMNEIFLNEISQVFKNFDENLDKEDLFLTTGFKSMISLKIANEIVEWFQNELMVNTYVNNEEDIVYMNKKLDSFIKQSDFGPQQLEYVRDTNTGVFKLNSFYKLKGTDRGIMVNSKIIESKGTLKLINFWIEFLEKFKKGCTFILDEFDSSIHPELVIGIIDLFNNLEINKAHSQLIFNTHNPLYLQGKYFRRDQIAFINILSFFAIYSIMLELIEEV